uniref:Reverse transcriptase domain-containing protein n=1 Tax=Tanacetum cinerariifolium TaxID=118510 RepID=A0A6L2P2G3_TANCI|nr:reverse transcriptase domain-containing protein [Tanacetum cinerariifolium]
MTIVTNERNELVPTRTVIYWCVYINYYTFRFQSNSPIKKRPHSPVLMEPTPTSVCLLVFAIHQQPFKDHSALKYLLAKQDAKPCLIRWILLLQEFDIEIKNKKGAKNITTDYLSRLKNPNLEELKDEDIDDNFPDETLMNIPSHDEEEILRLQTYENSKLYKARTKAYHDKKLRIWKEFKAEEKVLLFNSIYKFKAPKLGLKWYGPFVVKRGFPSGYVELYDKHRGSFIVIGHRVKLYQDEEQLNELLGKVIHLMCEKGKMRVIPFMAPFLKEYRKAMPWVTDKPFTYNVVENTCNEAKLYDLDETGKGIVKGNILYVKEDSNVNDALGYKKKAVVVHLDPLALVAEKTNMSKRKEKVVVSSNSKGSGSDDFSELKKITALLEKAFNRRKFYSKPTNNNLRTSSTSQSANKKQEFMLLAKKDSDEQVLLAEDQAWIESSSDFDQEINANMVFMAQIEKVFSESDESSSSAEENITEKCVFNANPDACITKFLENVNSLTSIVYVKTTPPRSGLTWKSTSRIFTSVGLRWIPTGKIVATCLNAKDSAIPLG